MNKENKKPSLFARLFGNRNKQLSFMEEELRRAPLQHRLSLCLRQLPTGESLLRDAHLDTHFAIFLASFL